MRWGLKRPRGCETLLIVMKPGATDAQVEEVLQVIRELGFKPHPMPGATRTAIGVTGNSGAIDPAHFEMLSGVAEAIRVSKPYKLVGRDLKHDDTIVRVGDVEIVSSCFRSRPT